MCNTANVEEMTDIVCPRCSFEDEFLENVEKLGEERPGKIVPSGQIMPLVKKKRGRPSTKPKEAAKPRGRPSKASKVPSFLDETSEESEAEELDEKLTELRLMGNSNILAKVFVDEALTCSKPIEAHIYDVELAMENPLPCFYCGEREIEKISFPMTEEKFPLRKRCQECGRGAAPRRKSRKLIPKTLKIPEKKISKVKKMRKSLI